jgi:hypothetical protein
VSIKYRLQKLEESVAAAAPDTITLTLESGKHIRVSEPRLQEIFDRAKSIVSPTGM